MHRKRKGDLTHEEIRSATREFYKQGHQITVLRPMIAEGAVMDPFDLLNEHYFMKLPSYFATN